MSMLDKRLEVLASLSYSSTIYVHGKTAKINELEPICNSIRRVNHKHSHLSPDRVEVPTPDHFMKLILEDHL